MNRFLPAVLLIAIVSGCASSGPAVTVGPTATASPTATARPAATARPVPTPTATPSATPTPYSRFYSTIHGITIDYPAGWQTRPATEPWTGDALGFDSPAADVIFDPALGDKVYLLMASIPYSGVRPGAIRADWPTDIEWLCPGGSAGSWQVDGVHAWVQECAAPSGANNIALVYADEGGYLIQLLVASDDPALIETYDWDWLKSLLETVDLRPEAALAASASPADASASPSMFIERFTSTIHGISIDYPSGWQTRPATQVWDHGEFTFDAPGVDVIFSPTYQNDLYLSIASAPLGGQSAEDWCCSELWAAAEVCESGGNFGRFTLDGASALVRGCDGFANRFEDHVVQAATATHGYVIYLHVAEDPILQAIYTERWFDAVLETVDLP